MGKKVSVGAAVALVAITVAVTYTASYNAAMKKFNASIADVNERQAMYSKLSEADTKVRQSYLGTVDESKLKDGMCAGYIAGLTDSNAQYMSAAKYKEYLAANSEKCIGIGVETIQDENGCLQVVTVFPGSAAAKSGIKKGDTVLEIDGRDVRKTGYGAAVNQLDGEAGSTVNLKLLQSAAQASQQDKPAGASVQTVSLDVARAAYEQNTVSSHVINNTVGYIAVSRFTASTPSQVSAAIDSLHGQNVAGIVFDLRNNPGGDVAAAGNILDTLLPAGNLISVIDREGKTAVEKTSDSKQLELPMSVIVNDATCGAAEIFASDIKDYKKGALVGDTTAGKGTKNEVTALSDGSAIVLPVANYVTPQSGVFTGAGIAPDISVSLSVIQRAQLDQKVLSETEDAQLQSAIAALSVQAARSGAAQ